MDKHPERISFRDTVASVALDALRGFAALLVVFDHCHNLFFLPLGDALTRSTHHAVLYLLYAFSSAGSEAVVMFFVLSGYLISRSVFRMLQQGTWSWKAYLTHRCVRLWLVLLPGLLLGAVWDTARLAMTGAWASNGVPQPLLERMAAAGLTGKILLGNMFFLQSIHVSTLGSNRVLWSLAAEFWYYMLFPLGLLALFGKTSIKMRVAYAVMFVAVALFATRSVVGLFPVWLCGTLLAKMKPPAVGKAVRQTATLLYLLCVFVLAMTPWPLHYLKMDYVLGLLTVVFLWVMLSATRKVNEQAVAVRASRRLAGFSYSLYVVHYPMLAFFAVWAARDGLWRPSPVRLAEGAALCTVALAYGYGVASLTEFHNVAVRRWVERLIDRNLWTTTKRQGRTMVRQG